MNPTTSKMMSSSISRLSVNVSANRNCGTEQAWLLANKLHRACRSLYMRMAARGTHLHSSGFHLVVREQPLREEEVGDQEQDRH